MGTFFVKWIVMEHWWLCDVCKKHVRKQSVWINKMNYISKPLQTAIQECIWWPVTGWHYMILTVINFRLT